MNQAQAISKLRKLLGPKLAYRISKTALRADARAEAAVKARELLEKKRAVEEALQKRRAELLADPTYQSLKAESEALGNEHERARSLTLHKPITVGRTEGIFFSVEAEGDSWAEVVAKVAEKKGVPA